MPTVEQNQATWDNTYDWDKYGEEWSKRWGSSLAQWQGTLLPRINSFLGTQTILELGPGFGRWTNFLKEECDELFLVDLSEKCIQACQQRFAADSHIRYYTNDGRSLAMIPDQSIDFVFSFDSLVHAEADVMQAYLKQLAAKLKPDGVGFIHHSNLAAYRTYYSLTKTLPRGRYHLMKFGVLDRDHWRASTMSASLFAQSAEQAGLQCIGQELVNWGSRRLIDCFSLFTKQNSAWSRPNHVMQNAQFMQEVRYIARVGQMYALERPLGYNSPVH